MADCPGAASRPSGATAVAGPFAETTANATIAVAGAPAPAGWAARTRTASALRAE